MANYGQAIVEKTLDELGVQFAERFESDWAEAWCPLHDDSGSSFTVLLPEGAWYCYAGCGGSSDLADLVTAITGEDVNDVRRRLGRGAAGDPKVFARLIEPPKPKITITRAKIEQEYPYQHGVVPKYFLRRGFTKEIAKLWDVGWDPEMRALVIPVYMDGKLRGLVKRPVDWKQGDGTKYKNTFGLKDALLGWDLIPFGIDTITVVEGPLDAMWLCQYGYPAVATLGSKMSEEQADMLVRRFWKVIIGYDPDKAGAEGVRKARLRLSRVQKSRLIIPENRKDVQECTPEELAEAYASLAPL